VHYFLNNLTTPTLPNLYPIPYRNLILLYLSFQLWMIDRIDGTNPLRRIQIEHLSDQILELRIPLGHSHAIVKCLINLTYACDLPVTYLRLVAHRHAEHAHSLDDVFTVGYVFDNTVHA